MFTDLISGELAKSNTLSHSTEQSIRSILLTRHEPQQELKHSDPTIKPNTISQFETPKTTCNSDIELAGISAQNDDSENQETEKFNSTCLNKFPNGAEVANVWAGEFEDLEKPVTAFIRLIEPRFIGDLSQVALPTRFIFFHLSPKFEPSYVFEIGRVISNMMVDKIFSEVAYKAKSKEDIIHGFEEFLDQLTVISPVESDDDICIEPPTTSPLQERRKLKSKDEYHAQIDDTLVRTGRFFGGLINDVKRKIPFYTSDFKNGVHIQSIGTIFYLYLATLTLNITCGYLMGIATDNYMATTECLLAAAFVNIAFALFGGQPLVIMGVSFQLFAIELIISRFCRDYSWDYLSFRCMIGLWLALYLLIIVAFDLSVIVRYITRFTQEIFTCVMASIFIIYESVTRLSRYPSNTYHSVPFCTCTCVPDNQTETMYTPYMNFNSTIYGFMQENSSIKNEVCAKLENVLDGSGRDTQIDNSDVHFLPILLCIGTFIIAWKLVEI
ncbi:sodium bicarbonate cotransporter 3-like [Mytilus edulis]|uniref:sodium bicarbonate cotransporter 3-like n=1 Tax=Mytilus edulis TaxID=6550 RepID=UPI0039EF18AE